VLARESAAEISNAIGATQNTIRAYEAIYFAVRDRLAQRDYIFAHVLGPEVYYGLRERQYDVLWKLFAYQGGPHVLEACLNCGLPRAHALDAAGASAFFTDSMRNGVDRRALIAMQTLSVDGTDALELLQLALRKHAEERAGALGISGETERTHLQAMLSVIGESYSAGRNTATRSCATDNGASEYTGTELIQLSVGGEPPALPNLHFPEPRGADLPAAPRPGD
jgi:hypothetical protein